MSGKKIGWALLAFLLAFSAAFLMLKGSGFFPEPNILDVLSLMVLIITLLQKVNVKQVLSLLTA